MSAATNPNRRLAHWSLELLELWETADKIAGQLGRTAGITKCLPPDNGLRDALVADLRAIESTARQARDEAASLREEIDRHARLRGELRLVSPATEPLVWRRSA